ncbi:T9SS type A sorting domain-containing protein [Spirosoma sp. KCTC 42546]|uniref:T9SS type A sorting domain-containing protein n=1 Tax=Spirosoma sp. KCTC 42546 TaxID=2520506 RepID=UPI00115B1904|nr:T9SS type A sorting domain-containing protein [Spirosoma sp. KCTC 42546]QDK83081.1 T9SS type A sorting domain-containing protein [Spirosoma sp. KCTC 42546]
MRLLLTFMGFCMAAFVSAQTPPKSLRIQISYEKSGQFLEQAVEMIEAVNLVSARSTVSFQAGQSIKLLPGFQAQVGSVFTADIKPVATGGELALQLKAFPNPFAQSTMIDYYLPADGKVNLWITDSQGKIVGQLVRDENQPAGQHRIEWKPDSLNDGVYIPVIESNQQRAVIRIVKK